MTKAGNSRRYAGKWKDIKGRAAHSEDVNLIQLVAQNDTTRMDDEVDQEGRCSGEKVG